MKGLALPHACSLARGEDNSAEAKVRRIGASYPHRTLSRAPFALASLPSIGQEQQDSKKLRAAWCMAGKYDELSREQLVRILEKRDRERKFGLVWERDEIEADQAIDENFVVATLDLALCERPAPWENLVIEGDNFDALRWLRMAYAGRVKCIYIDPPYNTGNKDWVYNDHYMDPSDRYRHSTWLEFLYRRLSLARDLLADDGVLLVSINDEQRAKLEMLLDEALPGMRVGSLVWRTRTGGNEGREAFLSDNHEYILVYGRSDFRFGGNSKTLICIRTQTMILTAIGQAEI
ncbi:site-specific DNA-methyltransferase [Mesorhizobium sp. M0340]|uniref:site-specific DNA-methyltransferase n=1 Tax=Mesorhizobium sp. M0340 TaxID=2956939 RepID=UPI003338061D